MFVCVRVKFLDVCFLNFNTNHIVFDESPKRYKFLGFL